ncbi:MAG: type II toxin-antitoxin system HicB family antitoxin [Magnetococcales bacterium]|nr:type II toxin-antitoxin system HicB family antitoxin [Magnetococcales bacterium]
MSVTFYPVIIEHGYTKDGESGFSAFFPDLPGCISAGDSLDETLLNAGKALELHLSAMFRDDEAIPLPSALDAMEPDPEVVEVLRTLVGVETPARWVNVNIAMADTLLHRIDTTANAQGMTRSGFLVEAARRMVETI